MRIMGPYAASVKRASEKATSLPGAARPQGIEAKGLTLPRRRHVTPRKAHTGPYSLCQRLLQAAPIEFTIAEQHDRCSPEYPLLYLLGQSDMQSLGKVPLLALAYLP
jgi:hypothetical protein